MKESYSQYGQDIILNDRIFKNKKNGFFVDIGAHDGISINNSYFLESELDWNGICIEPNPLVFEKLKQNRKAKCLNIGILSKSEILEFCKLSGYTEMLSGFLDFYHPDHKKRIESELKIHGGSKEIIKVQCLPFSKVVELHDVKKIDLLSIDVEGSEESIIRSIDFEQVEIDIIICENNYYETNIQYFLEEKGYSHIGKIQIDDVYKKNN